MTFSRALVIVSLILFGTIGVAAWQKRTRNVEHYEESTLVELALPEAKSVLLKQENPKSTLDQWPLSSAHLPHVDRIQELFNLGMPQLPIVETVTYSSRVPWLKGRPAWISDYASHFGTSRHFIARSLNGNKNYLSQDVNNGDHFNVFKEGRPLSFHLLVDASRCKLWFYYHDETTDERVLLKVYEAGLGRLDSSKASGLLTPMGSYQLGDNIAIYKPGIKGHYLGEKIEMVTIFGSRWVPFEKVIGGSATAPAKGYGIHGTPWKYDDVEGKVFDSVEGVGGYESDGCIRLKTEDIEEIFAIIVTKPTFIHIVRDFAEAQLPGKEVDKPEA